MDQGYSHDESHGDQQPTNTKAKLSDLNKNDLIDLISQLEHEVHNRDSVINEMMNQQTKQVLYQAKYGRFGAADPFTALHRDSDQVTNDHFDHNQVKSLFDNQLQQLENLIETQRRAQSTMREQKVSADERYKKVCVELEEAKRRHARDTAQGDDVTVALEKEREKLQQDLAYARNQLKKSEKELKKTKSQLGHQTHLATKHKQVALDLIKERRKMVSKVAESEKKNQAIAQLLHKEQEDSQKSENSRLLQLEARMEKQLMDFDIERAQYKARVRKEENKVKELLLQLTEIKRTVISLHGESTDGHAVTGEDSTDSASLTLSDAEPPVSLVESVGLSQTVNVGQNPSIRLMEPPVSTTDHRLGVQQTARVDPGPSLSPPPKSDKPRPLEQNRAANPRDAGKSTAASGTTQKSSESAASSLSRVVYTRPNSVTPQVGVNKIPATSSPSSVRMQNIGNTSNNKVSKMSDGVETLSSSVQPTNSQIPCRINTRSLAANVSTTPPQVSPKPVNMQGGKQSSSNIQSATKNTNRPASMSPKSTKVPPHLGAIPSSNADSVLVGNSNWRNSLPGGMVSHNISSNIRAGRPASTSLLSSSNKPTSPVGGVANKPKPPPPVRNVSLPPTKKYQSIENTSS